MSNWINRDSDRADVAKFSQCNVNRIIFDDTNQERSPFSFCFCGDSRLHISFLCDSNTLYNRSNSCYFLHNLYTLWHREHICFWCTCLTVNLPRAHFTCPKTMNKRIKTEPHCFVLVVGPAVSWNTKLIGRMISNPEKIFSPHFDEILYFYKNYQPHYGTVMSQCKDKHAEIEFVQILHWNDLDKAEAEKRTLLVINGLFTRWSKPQKASNS